MFTLFAGKLRKELREQYDLYRAGRFDYCKEVARRHAWRVCKSVVVATAMNWLGVLLLILFVSHAGLNKSLGNPVVGIVMFPIGWSVNRFFVFRDQYESSKPDWRNTLRVRDWLSRLWRMCKAWQVAEWPSRVWAICKTGVAKAHDGELDDNERWLLKTLGFMVLGQVGYQVMVTFLNWNFVYVKIGMMFTIGPLSLLANYWVFRRRVKKAQKAIAIETKIEPA